MVVAYGTDSIKDESWLKYSMRAAIELAFLNAAMVALADGGGETQMTVDLLTFVTAYKVAEFGFVESLVLSLRTKKFPEGGEGPGAIGASDADIFWDNIGRMRADGYAQGLDILYNNTKVKSAGERKLIFTGYDGTESCLDCQKYKGKVHPASWWSRNNAVPPNRDFECKGYNCLHVLADPITGKIFTL